MDQIWWKWLQYYSSYISTYFKKNSFLGHLHLTWSLGLGRAFKKIQESKCISCPNHSMCWQYTTCQSPASAGQLDLLRKGVQGQPQQLLQLRLDLNDADACGISLIWRYKAPKLLRCVEGLKLIGWTICVWLTWNIKRAQMPWTIFLQCQHFSRHYIIKDQWLPAGIFPNI